jgi:hypothetical protein
MAQYVKSTNFAVKDSLASGDPGKIVKGTELDIEFSNIATAVGTKADINNPTFIGTPTAPTATSSTNNTQIATTAFVQAAIAAAVTSTLEATYPIGSIYTNATDSTNPGTLLGFGTWTAFGGGRVPVGFTSADSLFNAGEKVGGSKDAIVVSHTHTASVSDSGHTHPFTVLARAGSDGGGGAIVGGNNINATDGSYSGTTSSSTTGITVTNSPTGSAATNANLPPFITVYLWKRVA